MAMPQPLSLTSASDTLLSAARSLLKRAAGQRGNRVKAVHVQQDYLEDSIDLCVVHRLCSRSDLESQRFDAIGKRLGVAMNIQDPIPAKTRRVERRQLLARGEKARKDANRPVRKMKRRA